MKNLTPLHWTFEHPTACNELLETLSSLFVLRESPQENLNYTLYDNFKWSIWHSDCLLVKDSANQFQLSGPTQSILETSTANSPKFWWDFPEGEFQSQLQKHIEYWAITPICTLNIHKKSAELLNNDNKIVVRLHILEHKLENNSHYFISLVPLRGYQKAFQSAAKICDQHLDNHCLEPNIRALLSDKGIEPKPKQTKVFGITPTEQAEQAVREMIMILIGRAEEYSPGIIADIDTEFLHYYRVSIRKARSLVNLMKKVFDTATQTQLKILLAKLANPTNQQRDLDVFLLNKKSYEELLPESFNTGCQKLFDTLQKERNTAFRNVKRFLNSSEHSNTLEELNRILTEDISLESKHANQPILQLAKKRIHRQYLKICALGRVMTNATPDEEVHDLRIECKKLRYLMEFFTELFPTKQMNNLTKALKSLQTILGDFNDYSVQKVFLAEHAEKSDDITMIAAINALIGVLHQKQIEQRAKVQAAFSAFGNNKVASQFTTLFS